MIFKLQKGKARTWGEVAVLNATSIQLQGFGSSGTPSYCLQVTLSTRKIENQRNSSVYF